MSNYPPGVTGMEYAIAGGAALTRSVECPHTIDEAPIQPNSLGERLITLADTITSGDVKTSAALDQIRALLAEAKDAPVAFDIDCEYEGDADGEVYDGIFAWTCPRCGHENETDLRDDED